MRSEVEVVDGPPSERPIVVCAVPITPAARERLGALLGSVQLVDIREVVGTADVVLSPPCSPHTIAALKRLHPGARLVVVELEDADLDIDLGGPVLRSRHAGADGYVAADSLADLAHQLTSVPAEEVVPELSAVASEPDELGGAAAAAALGQRSVDDLVAEQLRELERRRAERARVRGRGQERGDDV